MRRPERSLLTYLSSQLNALRWGGRFQQIETLALFLGFPRSGGTLLGSLLNAHRHVVFAHEQHLVDFFRRGYSVPQLYALALMNDQWFGSLQRKWTGYDYAVPNQWQGRGERLQVVGDKRGSDTARLLGQDRELLDRLTAAVQQPIRYILAVRNPFDNITTMQRRNKADRPLEKVVDIYFHNCRCIEKVMGWVGEESVVRVRHEELVADPRAHLSRVCSFLGVDSPEDYLRDCASIINERPRKTRTNAEWTDELVRKVEAQIEQFDFLTGYRFQG